jgi:hypothetical protein
MNLTQIILGNLAIVCIIVANVICYAAKAAIRKKGYPVSWFSYLGAISDRATLRKIIATAETPEEMDTYRRWLRRIYLSYGVAGIGFVLMFLVWLDMATRS